MATTYYLDTNILVDFLRGKLHSAQKLITEMSPGSIKIPAVVQAELEYGARHGARPAKALAATEQLLAPFEIVPFDAACARAYGAIRQELQVQGNTIGPNDMMIAATALANGAVLVTNNVDEFTRVPYLRVEAWDEIVLS